MNNPQRDTQQWAGMDGATAWHLIDRHANGWSEIADMMNAWLEANGGTVPVSDSGGTRTIFGPEGEP